MSTMCFVSPVFRQYCLWIGGIPATKGNFDILISFHRIGSHSRLHAEAATQAVVEHEHSLSVIPGGLAEMLECDPR
jgi:hypothetical protein